MRRAGEARKREGRHDVGARLPLWLPISHFRRTPAAWSIANHAAPSTPGCSLAPSPSASFPPLSLGTQAPGARRLRMMRRFRGLLWNLLRAPHDRMAWGDQCRRRAQDGSFRLERDRARAGCRARGWRGAAGRSGRRQGAREPGGAGALARRDRLPERSGDDAL